MSWVEASRLLLSKHRLKPKGVKLEGIASSEDVESKLVAPLTGVLPMDLVLLRQDRGIVAASAARALVASNEADPKSVLKSIFSFN